MNTDKKNQHFVPKFYLRNFSYKKNKKQIGVYNIKNKIFVQQAKLKTQGAKDFYYGHDGKIEDGLSEIEGIIAERLKNIINNKSIPAHKSYEHIDLLFFIALTDLRNPVRIENMKEMFKELEKRLLELDPNVDAKKHIPSITHDESIKLSLSNMHEIAKNIIDLEYKLLINKTNKPFISSDYPVIKYNQFLELKKWTYSKTSYGIIGLQIFIPLNSEICIIFFDSGIYKVGNKRQNILEINSEEDIDNINILQLINCLETIYFDEKASESYIKKLHEKAQKFKRANMTKSDLNYVLEKENNEQVIINEPLGKKNLIALGITDCETKLKVNGIKIHSKGLAYKLTPYISQLRKHVIKMKN